MVSHCGRSARRPLWVCSQHCEGAADHEKGSAQIKKPDPFLFPGVRFLGYSLPQKEFGRNRPKDPEPKDAKAAPGKRDFAWRFASIDRFCPSQLSMRVFNSDR